MKKFPLHTIIYSTISILLMLVPTGLYSQSISLQVVTKDVKKKISYKKGQILSMQGEKSEVMIRTWDKDYISVEMQINAQHPKRAIAAEDLKSFKYSFESSKDTIYIKNEIIQKEETLRSVSKHFTQLKFLILVK